MCDCWEKRVQTGFSLPHRQAEVCYARTLILTADLRIWSAQRGCMCVLHIPDIEGALLAGA